METVREMEADRSKISVIGIVDSLSAPELERELAGLLEEGVKHLLVDMEKTEYLSSAGIRTFLRIAKRLDASGGGLRFHGVHGVVRDVFRTTGVDRLFRMEEESLQVKEESLQ